MTKMKLVTEKEFGLFILRYRGNWERCIINNEEPMYIEYIDPELEENIVIASYYIKNGEPERFKIIDKSYD